MSDDEILLEREFETDNTESGDRSFSWGVQTFWRGQNKEVGASLDAPAVNWTLQVLDYEKRGGETYVTEENYFPMDAVRFSIVYPGGNKVVRNNQSSGNNESH
jgi:hypothetical protein